MRSKKHHFVPRSLLRFFSVGRAGKQIYAFDKHTGRSYMTSLMDAGSQNGYNELSTVAGDGNFEQIYDEVDARLGTLLRELHRHRDITLLSLDERQHWADMVAVQLVRTPIVRSTFMQLPKDLATSIHLATGEEILPVPELTENDARVSAVELFATREDQSAALQDKDFVLIQPVGSRRFLVSDHPVVRQSSVPYGDTGLQSAGVAVYMPLGDDLVLGLLCKSIGYKLNAHPLEQLPMEGSAAKRLIDLREGLRTGRPVQWSDDQVDAFNAAQVANSARFLYGSSDSFDDVRAKLQARPDLRDVRSLISVGKIGAGPGPAHGMPDGQWMVVFGRRSHYMLPLQSHSFVEGRLEAIVSEVALLREVLDDAPFSEVCLYVDKQQRMMKRDASLVVVDAGRPSRIQVRYADPGMDALDTIIHARKS